MVLRNRRGTRLKAIDLRVVLMDVMEPKDEKEDREDREVREVREPKELDL